MGTFIYELFPASSFSEKCSVGGEGGGQGQKKKKKKKTKTKQNKKKIHMEGRGSGERALGAKKLPCE